ncbi:MAG: alpha/beta hydrolase [Myxococcales bacterium]|nr:alpha/beta hydrolase [Myxococcales bacterium]
MEVPVVSWLFLGVCLVGAWLAWNVYRPLDGRYTAGPSFFLGWLNGELGIHHIFWQGVVTLVFIRLGALDHAPGQLGLAIALASWAALGFHYLRGFEAKGALDRALDEALGPDHAPMPDRVAWGPILRPFPIHAPGVERIRNVVYGRAAAQDLKLDLYRPRGTVAGAGLPVFFYVHGGGWVIGTKNTQGLPIVNQLAERGWLCVNVNYRLSPGATFPDHLIDLKRALHWLRNEGVAYGADPDFVAVGGGSAGGHLSALLALTAGDPEYQPGFEDADTSVQAAVPIFGVYDFVEPGKTWGHGGLAPFLEKHVMKATFAEDPKAFEKASPLHRIGPDAPPFLVVHGGSDTLVPPGEAREFVRAFRETASAPIGYAEIPGAQHAFDQFPSLRSQITRRGIEIFLEGIREAHVRRSAAA